MYVCMYITYTKNSQARAQKKHTYIHKPTHTYTHDVLTTVGKLFKFHGESINACHNIRIYVSVSHMYVCVHVSMYMRCSGSMVSR